jgi:hypothetical protein
MKNTFFYGVVFGELIVLWIGFLEPFKFYSVITITTILLMITLVSLITEDKIK